MAAVYYQKLISSFRMTVILRRNTWINQNHNSLGHKQLLCFKPSPNAHALWSMPHTLYAEWENEVVNNSEDGMW